jgi:hypothetical protein
MDCSAARRQIAVMNHDLKRIIYRIENFNKPMPSLPIYQSIKVNHLRNIEKYSIANELNNMMTNHRKRIEELQITTGCPSDYMKMYNTGIIVCEFH